ncbi:hypothetical protein. In SS9 not in 3TCK [Photobacterium kishitanii]|nr:hypothetical protein. In SS9 not in 3TCK [Photobacterium kishitanii]
MIFTTLLYSNTHSLHQIWQPHITLYNKCERLPVIPYSEGRAI